MRILFETMRIDLFSTGGTLAPTVRLLRYARNDGEIFAKNSVKKACREI
ncbi:MAG: hypothetical protein LBE82_13235 [Chitinophagaceae bacterium]|nr:hypothetical protein [Chitinophagaceae bacterium]